MITQEIKKHRETLSKAFGGPNTTAINSVFNIGASGVSSLGRSFLFFLGPIFLDPSLFGTYSYFYWVSSISVTLGSAGAVLAVQRFTSRCQPEGQQQSLMRFASLITLGQTLVALATMLALPRNVAAEPKVLLAVVLFAILGALVAVQVAELQANHNFGLPFLGESLSQVFRLGALWLLRLLASLVPWSFLALEGAVSLVKSLLLLRAPTGFSTLFHRGQRALNLDQRREIFTNCILPVTVISVLDAILWQRGEIFFLGLYGGAAATAFFSGASQIGQIFVLAPTAALASLIPKMAEKSRGSKTQFDEAAGRVFTLAVLLAVPLYCCGLAFGPLIIHFWKPQYSAVSDILPFIMLGRVALLVSAPVSMTLYASGRERFVLVITSVSAAFALLSDFMLISHWHLLGASIACAANQVLTAAITFLIGARFIRYRLRIRPVTRFVLAAVAIAQIAGAATVYKAHAALGGIVIYALTVWQEPAFREEIRMLLSRRSKG